MTKHTPGPWNFTTRRGSWDWVVYQKDDPNLEICQMFHDGTEFNERGAANAKLVAAAPRLLDALVDIVEQSQALQNAGIVRSREADTRWIKANAAIREATGDKIAAASDATQWQPIETAPKDGRHLIAADFTSGAVGFGWCGNLKLYQAFMDVVHWFEDGFYSSTYGADQQEPFLRLTHWMPLPPPPSTRA